jgi:hypothetical protein
MLIDAYSNKILIINSNNILIKSTKQRSLIIQKMTNLFGIYIHSLIVLWGMIPTNC